MLRVTRSRSGLRCGTRERRWSNCINDLGPWRWLAAKSARWTTWRIPASYPLSSGPEMVPPEKRIGAQCLSSKTEVARGRPSGRPLVLSLLSVEPSCSGAGSGRPPVVDGSGSTPTRSRQADSAIEITSRIGQPGPPRHADGVPALCFRPPGADLDPDRSSRRPRPPLGACGRPPLGHVAHAPRGVPVSDLMSLDSSSAKAGSARTLST